MDMPTLAADTARTAAPFKAQRFDLYQPIHKGLRSFLGATLVRLGAIDLADAGDVAAALAQADSLLELMTAHLEHENDFLHPAIESRRPGATSRIAGEHVEHRDSIEALKAEVAALRREPLADRALRLYRHFALFVAENLEHMHFEETVHNEALWATYGDAELLQIHEALMATVSPQELAQVARWMIPALDPATRAGLLGGLQAAMPPENFRALLDLVRPVLDEGGWVKLARALGLPPVSDLLAG